MDMLDHVWLGILAVIEGPALVEVLGVGIPVTLVMVAVGFVLGVAVGATPGLSGPMAMAIALPVLISVFGYRPEALLPVSGFLIGIMKGATVGGAVPAILFNIPGTPDSVLTALDGHPMARAGQGGRALRVAHLSSATGDTVSDIVLFLCAPFLAVLVEAYFDLPEKTALILFALAFIAAVIGRSPARGLISAGLGMLVAAIGSGGELTPRMTLGAEALERGLPVAAVVLGVLVLGQVLVSLEDLSRTGAARPGRVVPGSLRRLRWREVVPLLPFIANSAAIGTAIGALPGVGSTLAATLGHASGRRLHDRCREDGPGFGDGVPEGVAATEAANSAVSGANLIPVLSLGVPGNAAAIFLILAFETIGGFSPGPSVFRLTGSEVNPEMVLAFGIFTAMAVANLINWTLGFRLMRTMALLARVPRTVLLPAVLLVTLTAVYAQETEFSAIWITLGFGVLGYLMRRAGMSVLPFIIAFILFRTLEETARQAFSATGGDPWFLFSSPIGCVLVAGAVAVIMVFARRGRGGLAP